MGTGSDSASTAGWGLLAVLAGLAVLPAWAVLPDAVESGAGVVPRVLYRQPKLAVGLVLSWVLLVGVAWRVGLPRIAPMLRVPGVASLLAFVALSAASAGWSLVPSLALYELQQWVPFAGVAVVVAAWAGTERRVQVALGGGLVAAAAGLTLVGLVQAAAPELVAVLLPARPSTGVLHAGLMGHKNAAGHMVLGQLWVLVAVAGRARRLRGALAALGLVEVAYLASLQSRAALVALCGSSVLAGLLVGLRRRGAAWAPMLGGLALGGLAVAVAVWSAADAERWAMLVELATDPARYLDTDRGAYAVNSMNMAFHHPFGVGVGNWQAEYPVHRLIGRDVGFHAAVQVRRAHADPFQILAEVGVLGALLWAALVGWTVHRLGRRWWRQGDLVALGLALQLVCTSVAGCADYVLEMPATRLQFMLVLALGLARAGGLPVPRRSTARAALVTGLALVAVPLAVGGLLLARHSSRIQALHAVLIEDATGAGPDAGRAARVARTRWALGQAWDASLATPGLSKTRHRDHLAVAHVHALGQEWGAAVRVLEAGLVLHPYGPSEHAAMARALEGMGEEARADLAPKSRTTW